MFKNPLHTPEAKKETRKLHRNVKAIAKRIALRKAMRTGSQDEEGRWVPDADRNRND